MKSVFFFLFSFLILSNCSTKVDPSNPYDPDIPCALQAEASIGGEVSLKWLGDVEEVEVFLVPAGLSTHPDAQGKFQLNGVIPCSQEIHFALDGFEEVVLTRQPLPGENLQLAVKLEPKTGSLRGTVVLEDRSDHAGVSVEAIPDASRFWQRTAPNFSYTVLTGSDGRFFLDQLPAGKWQLSAQKAHYLPTSVQQVTVGADQVTSLASVISLPPVAGDVEILSDAQVGGLRYSNDPLVTVRTLAVNSLYMMISEDPQFADEQRGDTQWQAYAIEREFTLSQGDGPKTLYVLLQGEHEVQSEVLSADVILDTTAPTGSVSMVLDNNRCQGQVCYTNSESLLLNIQTSEPEIKMIISLDEDFGEPVQLYTPYSLVLLANTNQPQQIYVRLIDVAGNTTETLGDLQTPRQVVLDLNPPTLPLIATDPSGYTNQIQGLLQLVSASTDDTAVRGYEMQVTPPTESLGNGEWMPVSFAEGPVTFSLVNCSAPACSHRSYLFKLRALDWAGNLGDPASVSLELDQSPPEPSIASVTAMQDTYGGSDRLGSRVVNADAVTVWVALASSADYNFDQFLVRANGGNWQETGIGAGGMQIPVILQSDAENIIEIKARDLAGNESVLTEDSIVVFTEDSQPPLSPVLYPDESTVNADQVSLRIQVAANDPGGRPLDHYEVSTNGEQPFSVAADAQNFLVDLRQNYTNSIQIRAIDQAGNYSGSAVATVVEDSNLLQLSELPVTSGLLGRGLVQIREIRSTALENDILVASLSVGTEVNMQNGVLVYNLSTADSFWLPGLESQRIQLVGGRFVAERSLYDTCQTPADPTVDPATEPLCVCRADPALCAGVLEPHDTFSSQLDQLKTLVMVDINAGYPELYWIATPDIHPKRKRPLIYFRDEEADAFYFDGIHLAWIESPNLQDDRVCRIYVVTLPPYCDPTVENCSAIVGLQLFESPEAERCSLVTVADRYVFWAERMENTGNYRMASLDTAVVAYLNEHGMDFGDFDAAIAADCYLIPNSAQPVCNHLFWADFEKPFPFLRSLDLRQTAFLPLEESSDMVRDGYSDTIYDGAFELDRLVARDGKVAWENAGTGSTDILYLDLEKCNGQTTNLDCLGKEKEVAVTSFQDEAPAMDGDRVAYWRKQAEGFQFRIDDLSNQPWLVAEPGLQGFPKLSGQTILYSYMYRTGEVQEMSLRVLDLLSSQVSSLGGIDAIMLPFAYHYDASGPLARLTMLHLNDQNLPALAYCEGFSPSACDQPVSLFTNSLPGWPQKLMSNGMIYGDEVRALFNADSIDGTRASFLVGCKLDPQDIHACADGPQGLQVLLSLVGSQCEQPSDQWPRIYEFALDGDQAAIVLIDECTGQAQAYMLDLVQLEQTETVQITDINTLDGLPGIKHLHQFDHMPDAHGGFDRLMDMNNGNIVMATESDLCSACQLDVESTTLVKEDCDSPPCCGQSACQCDLPVGNACRDHARYKFITYMNENIVLELPGVFSHSEFRNISLVGNWLVWRARINNLEDAFLYNFKTGQFKEMTYRLWSVSSPILFQFYDGLHLLWVDARLGEQKFFHTRLGG